MKIKAGFITNSSSTSFVFIFKGDKWDLYRELVKHQDQFELNYNNSYYGNSGTIINIDVWKVIREMDDVLYHYKEDVWIKPKIVPINDYLAEYKLSHEHTKKSVELEENPEFKKWYTEDIIKEENVIKIFETAIKNGFTSVIHLGFGDNHGDIQGGDVGTTMDYEGRVININDNTLIIYTEQNR